jgi:pimeloyl-ACP methyl ester carboxylesterase
MPQLQRDATTLYYEVHGRGPTVLLTHGYGATSAMWTPQIDALASRWQLVIWDVRGHGRSGSPATEDAYAERHAVADMAAILDAVGAPRAVIGGLSLGGYLALAFHLAHPSRTRALLLCDTGPGYRNGAARAAWNDMAIKRAEALERDGLAALGASGEVAVSRHESAIGLARAARGLLTQHDARVIESLPTIRCPTRVIVGALDQPFLAPSHYMAGKIPGASEVVIEGAGHAANIDRPRAFNAAVIEWLDALGPA